MEIQGYLASGTRRKISAEKAVAIRLIAYGDHPMSSAALGPTDRLST